MRVGLNVKYSYYATIKLAKQSKVRHSVYTSTCFALVDSYRYLNTGSNFVEMVKYKFGIKLFLKEE